MQRRAPFQVFIQQMLMKHRKVPALPSERGQESRRASQTLWEGASKERRREVRQGGPPGGGDKQAKTWMRRSWPCEGVWEGCSRKRKQGAKTPRWERCGVFKTLKGGYWGQGGGRKREEGVLLGRLSGDRGSPGKKACRRENGGGEVGLEAHAGVLELGWG